MTTLRENICRSARRPITCAAKSRNTAVETQADNAKLPVQIREYSVEIFSANAAANRKENVVAKTMTILSTNANGRMIGSNSYRPAKFISIIVTSQTKATAAA